MRSVRPALTHTFRHGLVQQRLLHITGAVKQPSYALGVQKESLSALDLQGLRKACQDGGLSSHGTMADLVERLNAQSVRAFSAVSTRRPNAARARSNSVRTFNTSKELRRPRDNSTIDFMYFPTEAALNSNQPEVIHVPILPHNDSTRRVDIYKGSADENVVQKPTIAVIGGESTHITSPSAMAEVHDNASSVDGHILSEIAGQVSNAARQVAIGAEKQGEVAGGIAKQIWKGFLDDVFGVKHRRVLA